MFALCTRRTSDCTTSDIGGRNSGSGCKFQEPASAFQAIWLVYGLKIIFLTWTHRAMASAKRERDLDGYRPCSAGSTIWSSASMSCSCGVAQRTSDCSARGRDLQKFREQLLTIYVLLRLELLVSVVLVALQNKCERGKDGVLQRIDLCSFTCQTVSGQSEALAWRLRSCTRRSSGSTDQTRSPQVPCILSSHLIPEIVAYVLSTLVQKA